MSELLLCRSNSVFYELATFLSTTPTSTTTNINAATRSAPSSSSSSSSKQQLHSSVKEEEVVGAGTSRLPFTHSHGGDQIPNQYTSLNGHNQHVQTLYHSLISPDQQYHYGYVPNLRDGINRSQRLHSNGGRNGTLNMEMERENDSEIAAFYHGRSIFITGATGFMGKVLVEKLLRSCSGVKNIYVLLRTKKGLEAKARLQELIDAKVFDRLKEEDPKALKKLVPIQGDISLPGLGISETDLDELVREVSIVFHSAATVKFDEPLKTSVEFNVVGTRRLVQLCHKMKKLVAFIHVSTAYANCDRKEVQETLYEPPIAPQKIIDAVEWMDEDLLNHITPKLLGNRPNTYTYTKALAENLLVEEGGSLPVAIVRPSIVTAAWREPIPGWIDNINGPTGLVLASGKGVLRTMYVDTKCCADLIPVDTVINLMISVAWFTAVKRPNQIMVFNCASGTTNGITWGDIERIAFPMLLRYPSANIFRYPGGSFKNSRLINTVAMVYEHLIPAYIVDTFCFLTRKKSVMSKIYNKLHRAVSALEWFTTREWKFHCNNLFMLSEQLKGSDKQTFHFDIRDLHWPTYWEDYILGIRKFILKEDIQSLPQARRNLRRLYYVHKLISFLLVYGLWHMVVLRSSMAKKLWLTMTALAMRVLSYFPFSQFNNKSLHSCSQVTTTLANSSSTTPASSSSTFNSSNTTKISSSSSSSNDASTSSSTIGPQISTNSSSSSTSYSSSTSNSKPPISRNSS